jgi:hypothetical protein
VTLVQNEDMVETLPADILEEALTDGIGSRGMDGSPEYLDTERSIRWTPRPSSDMGKHV